MADLKNITIGESSLEGWLAEQEAKKSGKEKNLEDKEKIDADRKAIYSSPHYRHEDKPEESGKVFQYPPDQINKMNIKEALRMAIEKKQSVVQLIINVMIDGARHSAVTLSRRLTEEGRPTTAKQISGPLGVIYKRLEHFIERSGTETKAYIYMLNNYGQAISPDLLYKIHHTNHSLNAWNIADEVPYLLELGYEPPEGEPTNGRKKYKRKNAPQPPDHKRTLNHDPEEEATVELEKKIEKGLKTLLPEIEKDINLNVNVHINFSFSME